MTTPLARTMGLADDEGLYVHPEPLPWPGTLTGYEREILRRVAERGTVAHICRGLTGKIVDGIGEVHDRLWQWGLIGLRGRGRAEPLSVLTRAGREAMTP